MDAAEQDQDVLLQRTSPELLADLQSSLKPFLWRTTTTGKTQIRKRVRVRETDRLISLLEPFQELPQLLDPHLDKLVPVLAEAFLAFLRSPAAQQSTAPTQLLAPLSQAICRLLYTFCKIRGEKVIVRFFSTETRHLELLLSAIEEGSPDRVEVSGQNKYTWDWKERYITLLWLSQLLLAPFDLSTISSASSYEDQPPAIPGFKWPANVPGVTIRVIPLAIRYLSSSGKERDAAKVLLVRVAMRRDMQELGVLHALVQWTLSSLEASSDVEHSSYFYIGVLSFLAGILSSSTSTADMTTYLPLIYQSVENASSSSDPRFTAIQSLAVARNTIIKVSRTISILALQTSQSMSTAQIVEGTIASLLEALSDPATPVRLAASKALSMITLKLDPELAGQVIQAILEALEVNVIWARTASGSRTQRDLSRVNPYEWHGLILTLSHLLYRRSPPPSSLPQIIPALFLGLSFEQRSTTGASVGTNVRDAACFGIWALARRYRTEELQSISIDSTLQGSSNSGSAAKTSILQSLATSLVVSASLDPAGNIRRGSSAALQELIGRHPNTIEEGISVVQVVDYHAVALRSRATQEVAVQAARLSNHYRVALMDDLLGWRGVQDTVAMVRRNTAVAVKNIVCLSKGDSTKPDWKILKDAVARISSQISKLAPRDSDERHGLILCLASVLEGAGRGNPYLREVLTMVNVTLSYLDAEFSQLRGVELLAEATSRLILASYTLLRNSYDREFYETTGQSEKQLNPAASLDISLVEGASSSDIKSVLSDVEVRYKAGVVPDPNFMKVVNALLMKFMEISDMQCVDAVADAASDHLLFLDAEKRSSITTAWVERARKTGRGGAILGNAYLHTLFRIIPIAGQNQNSLDDTVPTSIPDHVSDIIEAIKFRWKSGHEVEGRATLMRCLAKSAGLLTHTHEFIGLISQGLDDYTTNARGDVGSFVRIEAAKVVTALWQDTRPDTKLDSRDLFLLVGKIFRLSAEKLDKVRAEGQRALIAAFSNKTTQWEAVEHDSVFSIDYFKLLLQLTSSLPTLFSADADLPDDYEVFWRRELLAGYVTSADTGSEDLVRASRAALAFTQAEESTQSGKPPWIVPCLVEVMKSNQGNDRVLVPVMEVLSFLFDVGFMDTSFSKTIFAQTQKAHYKTGNVRKLEAAVKIYGGLLEIAADKTLILQKLTSMLLHPFPKVRNMVVEELWCRCEVGKGVSWVKAGKQDVENLKGELKMKGL